MPSFSDFTFTSSTGKNHIHARQCMPDGAPRAVLQIAHGIAEHIDRYDDFAAFLAQNGILVVGNDHLGHGKSVSNSDDLGFFAEENQIEDVDASAKGHEQDKNDLNGEENEAVSDLLPLETAETANEERGADGAIAFSPNAMKLPEKPPDGERGFNEK